MKGESVHGVNYSSGGRREGFSEDNAEVWAGS